jgi:predicted transposase/invertase (TIGR01784 family)
MRPQRISDPHDAFFKQLFGRPKLVREFLSDYLPPRVYSRIAPDSLQVVKDSFIDKELSRHFSDLLYKARIGKRKGFIYLLFEHKSHIDPRVSFQLLRNMVKIWERHGGRGGRSKSSLPVIIPLVIYHGVREWNGQEDFRRLFDVDSDLERYIPRFEVDVYDLSHLPPEAIRGRVVMRAAVLLLGHIFRPDLNERVPDVLRLLTGATGARDTKELIEVFIRYLLAASPAERQETLTRTVVEALEEGDDTMYSIADKLRDEGLEKGRQRILEEGLEQGLERGLERGKRETVVRAGKQGLSVTQIAAITGFSAQKVRAILRAAKRR